MVGSVSEQLELGDERDNRPSNTSKSQQNKKAHHVGQTALRLPTLWRKSVAFVLSWARQLFDSSEALSDSCFAGGKVKAAAWANQRGPRQRK
jgi:dihydrodipicolinate reductase